MKLNPFQLLLAICVSLPFVSAQNAPVITTAHASEITVDGMADQSAGPITILDTFYPSETRVGKGGVGRDGKFAVVVKPALTEGHRLVAVDKQGRRSAVFTIAPRRSGSVPGAPK